jgi:hypothetical protein
MRIELTIERLVLEGVTLSFGQRAELAAALEAELGRSLARTGMGAATGAGGAVPRLSATAALGSGSPRALARGIAAGVHGALTR